MKKQCETIIDCPQKKEVVFTKNGFEILECNVCHHRFTIIKNHESHLSNIYSDSYFFDGKDGYPDYLEEKEILVQHGTRYAKIISKYIDNPGRILDVGCAAGFILKGFEQQGWSCYGIEPNKTMVEYGIKEFGFNLQIGSLESFESDQKYDLITLIQVIGHFHDLDKALKNARNFLNPGGLVLVESWNRNSILAKLLGKHWHEYSPASVIHWFTDKTLIDLFEFHGFKLVKKGLPLKQINLKHAISALGNMIPNFALKHKLIHMLGNSFGKLKLIYPPVDIKWYIYQKVN
jgi:2-polyprenyl-3-methyl-5-hydroxy-6-metoxy-1,4-benzoquinol methylase